MCNYYSNIYCHMCNTIICQTCGCCQNIDCESCCCPDVEEDDNERKD